MPAAPLPTRQPIAAAYRAAGQAVAALRNGAPVAYVDVKGAMVRWPGLAAARHRDASQVLAGTARRYAAGVTSARCYRDVLL